MKEKIRTLEDLEGWVVQRYDSALKMWRDIEWHPYNEKKEEKEKEK